MFTGLVQAVGTITTIRPLASTPQAAATSTVRIHLDPGSWAHRPVRGDSIAISGTCLTLVSDPPPSPGEPWAFDAIPETLAKTRLGRLRPGSRVNLEHAATMSTLLGGHLVQGHVDAVATVVRVDTGDDWRVYIQLPAPSPESPDLGPYILHKGSICVDGVSLTVAGLWRGSPDAHDPASPVRGFHVALIPTTLELTTLKDLSPGDEVNLEVDAAAKAIVDTTRAYLEAQLPGAIAAQIAAQAPRGTKTA